MISCKETISLLTKWHGISEKVKVSGILLYLLLAAVIVVCFLHFNFTLRLSLVLNFLCSSIHECTIVHTNIYVCNRVRFSLLLFLLTI